MLGATCRIDWLSAVELEYSFQPQIPVGPNPFDRSGNIPGRQEPHTGYLNPPFYVSPAAAADVALIRGLF
jgi:hypothetical protein